MRGVPQPHNHICCEHNAGGYRPRWAHVSSADHHRLRGDAVVVSFVDEPLRAVSQRHSEKDAGLSLVMIQTEQESIKGKSDLSRSTKVRITASLNRRSKTVHGQVILSADILVTARLSKPGSSVVFIQFGNSFVSLS